MSPKIEKLVSWEGEKLNPQAVTRHKQNSQGRSPNHAATFVWSLLLGVTVAALTIAGATQFERLEAEGTALNKLTEGFHNTAASAILALPTIIGAVIGYFGGVDKLWSKVKTRYQQRKYAPINEGKVLTFEGLSY